MEFLNLSKFESRPETKALGPFCGIETKFNDG